MSNCKKKRTFCKKLSINREYPFYLTVTRRTARVADDHRLLSIQRYLLGFSSDNFPHSIGKLLPRIYFLQPLLRHRQPTAFFQTI